MRVAVVDGHCGRRCRCAWVASGKARLRLWLDGRWRQVWPSSPPPSRARPMSSALSILSPTSHLLIFCGLICETRVCRVISSRRCHFERSRLCLLNGKGEKREQGRDLDILSPSQPGIDSLVSQRLISRASPRSATGDSSCEAVWLSQRSFWERMAAVTPVRFDWSWASEEVSHRVLGWAGLRGWIVATSTLGILDCAIIVLCRGDAAGLVAGVEMVMEECGMSCGERGR